ncbi:hypothetical protein ACFQQB_57325 [Nonomuraea rubra]|uniref:hypothetical protein n=1 Tax=Nonomuraea rubra TaxID=46180 RepID=UPI0031E56BCC
MTGVSGHRRQAAPPRPSPAFLPWPTSGNPRPTLLRAAAGLPDRFKLLLRYAVREPDFRLAAFNAVTG